MSIAIATPAASAPRLRLTRRGRAVLTTLAAMPLVLAALSFALNSGMATATDANAGGDSLSYVTVSGGESLWQVAEAIDPNADTREVVAQLLQFNELASADVFAGQRLAVPYQYN